MKHKFLIIVVALIVISFATGWWRAGLHASDLPDQNDTWRTMNDANIDPQHYSKIATDLKATDIFPISREEAKRLAETEVAGTTTTQDGVPEFPKIAGASVLNGIPHVHLLLADNSFVKAKSGDELESGWQLISVDLQRVSAVYDGKEQEFLVTDYKSKEAGDKNKQ